MSRRAAAPPMSFPAGGTFVCGYAIEVCYPDRRPFLVGTFTVPRKTTEQATEAAALSEATTKLEAFFKAHFPDGAPRPPVTRVRLGSLTFIPDDYEWRPNR